MRHVVSIITSTEETSPRCWPTTTTMTTSSETKTRNPGAKISDEILLQVFQEIHDDWPRDMTDYRLVSRRFQNVVADIAFRSVTISGYSWTKRHRSNRPPGMIRLGDPTWYEPWGGGDYPPSDEDQLEENQMAFRRIAPLIRELRVSLRKSICSTRTDAQLT